MKIHQDSRPRRSIRLKGYDYAGPGGYYFTIVTRGRECLFGQIVNEEIRSSELGRIVCEEWLNTADLRPYVQLHDDEFVVMPNHVHGIWIFDETVGARRRRASTTPRFGKPIAGFLPNIVRAFKAAVTYRAGRELGLAYIWQRNYGACPERSEGNTSSGTNPITNASPATLPSTLPNGKTMKKTP
jgi:REP element-mobilizing transposase RayT